MRVHTVSADWVLPGWRPITYYLVKRRMKPAVFYTN